MNGIPYGDQNSGLEPLARKIWRNVIPEDSYDKSLFYCYDAALAKYGRGGISKYIYGALHCCTASSFAAGDQDLGGVGVSIQTLHRLAFSNREVGMQTLATLVFEALFTCLALIEAIWGTPEGTHRFHLPSAIKGTIATFLDTGIFFSLSVFIASVVALGQLADGLYYQTDILSSIFNFTVGPLLVVVSLHFDQLRRRKLRIGIVVALVLLSLVLCFLAVFSGHWYFQTWPDICCPILQKDRFLLLVPILNVTFTVLLVHQLSTPTIFYFLNLVFRPHLWKMISEGNTFLNSITSLHAERQNLRQDRRKKRGAWLTFLFELYRIIIPNDQPFGWRLAIYSFVFTWSQLVYILYRRFLIGECAKGRVYKENQFGFGQALAAFMWLPVLADLGDILCSKSLSSTRQ